MVDYINKGEKLEERPINLEDIRDRFIAYHDNLPFGILSKSSYIDLKKMKIVSSVIFDDEYKILKTESRIMVKSLRTLKMPLFLGFLRNLFIIHFDDNLLEEELLEYIELNRNKVQYVWIDEFQNLLKELREMIVQESMVEKELRKEINVLKLIKENEIDFLEWRLRMKKISMEDNDKDEYFQHMEFKKKKVKSKQNVDKMSELIREKEMNILDDDAILELENYRRDVKEELRIVKIKIEKLKVSEERIEELRL